MTVLDVKSNSTNTLNQEGLTFNKYNILLKHIMGLFSKQKINKKITTRDFYFGFPEAEGENVKGQSLTDYFEDYLDIIREIDKGRFLFIGRKGVGKSAIAKYIKDISERSEDTYAALLRISDFDKENIIQKSNNESNNALIFEWLILINIVKLIVKSQAGKYTNEFQKLEKFLERNTGSVEIDKFETSEIFIKSGGEISFEVLTHAFNGILKKYFDSKTKKAPFYKLITPLKEIVKKILSFKVIQELEFCLLFDDLDINYSIDDKACNDNIIELLRIAKNYNNEVFNVGNAKILVFIRKDINDVIISKYSDSAKLINSYGIDINWYSNDSFENHIPLKKMANKRIELNFKRLDIQYNTNEVWSSLIPTTWNEYKKSSFKYVLDFTFYRPRDIITFLDTISKEDYNYPIDYSTLKKILKKYIQLTTSEIKSELSLYFLEEEKELLFSQIFPFIASNNDIKLVDVINLISSLGFNIESEKVVNILFAYNLLIYKHENGNLIINYREDDLGSYNKEKLYICLHKCLYHYYKPIV